ncbi:LON peptidase substrate-binding domain-containing protein, partial [Metamycoplasma equirhinis]|uniref:LON peptidase substrate-binding domain-containing protein n=1 Tax=Metamycoplasma equirhinis TaxID=92402 RepID=UPI003593C90F
METIKIGKQNSINSLNLAIDKYDSTFLATFLKPSNKTITNPSLKDLEEFGVLVYIHTLDNKNGVYTIEVKAANRCKILDIKTSKRGDEEIKLVECQEETLENKGALEFEKKRLVIGDKLKELSNVPNYGI